MQVTLLPLGAAIQAIQVPDRKGRPVNVALGYPDIEDYFKGAAYLGAVCGRVANRIREGRFTLDGKKYQLTLNNNGHHLHGGTTGFNHSFWKSESVDTPHGPGFRMTHVSPDNDQGYPGRLLTAITYSLRKDNALVLEYEAEASAPTLVNLTNHVYLNLAGEGEGNILDHGLRLDADFFTETDAELLPTGRILPVEKTALDFRNPKPVGRDMDRDGFDGNWVLNDPGDLSRVRAELYCPRTGIGMQCFTTEPGMQFYSGNFLDGKMTGLSGRPYGRHAGLCLEAQKFPDAQNHPHFPGIVLRPGETYRQTTIYKFSAS